MALVYPKLTDETIVLSPRQAAFRQFNIGDDWTEARFGVFITAIAATGSDDDNVNETLVPSVISDRVTFGLKDTSDTYPGQAGSLFIGARSGESTVVSSAAGGGIGSSSGNFVAVGYNGTSEILGVGANIGRIGTAVASGSTSYCDFFALRFVINNRGLSTQTITIYGKEIPHVAGSDYSANALRTLLNNQFASVGALDTIPWNDGASARAIPDCVWIRSPLFDNALRISCARVIRYAP